MLLFGPNHTYTSTKNRHTHKERLEVYIFMLSEGLITTDTKPGN